MKNFNCKIESLELRTCDKNLANLKEHITAEIVQWKIEKNRCWTIAYWSFNDGSPYLKFVGTRPLMEDIDKDNFWFLVETGYKFLENKQR